MSERPLLPPGFQPAPLSQQVDAILRETQLAKERLPKLAAPRTHGAPPKLCWGTVHQRIHEFRSLAHTLMVLERLAQEGRLPPELQEAGQGMAKTAPP